MPSCKSVFTRLQRDLAWQASFGHVLSSLDEDLFLSKEDFIAAAIVSLTKISIFLLILTLQEFQSLYLALALHRFYQSCSALSSGMCLH